MDRAFQLQQEKNSGMKNFSYLKPTVSAETDLSNPLQSAILSMQKTYGNRYVQELVSGERMACPELCGLKGPLTLSPTKPAAQFKPHSCDSCLFHPQRSVKRVAAGAPNLPGGIPLQAKLKIGQPGDVYEQEADRVADMVLQRQCTTPECEEEEMLQMKQTLSPIKSNEDIVGQILQHKCSGRLLEPETREFMESRFGYDFSDVRIHSDACAAKVSNQLGAKAFTMGKDIYLGAGRYSPGSTQGKRLLGHELTHLVQQGKTDRQNQTARRSSIQLINIPCIQRDLAIEPPHPEAVSRNLTPEQMEAAIRYNRSRFHDPYSIRVIRDVLGLEPVPAVVDEAFVLAVVPWQAERGLRQDGMVGVITTRSFVRELRADDERLDALQLRLDNRVRARTTSGPDYRNCREFNWEIEWETTLRNGWIVQEFVNQDNIRLCDGTPHPGGAPNTPHYWEAWRVAANGNVTPAGDTWFRASRPGTRGTWRIRGRVYTVGRLDPAAGFASGNVPDAGILHSTTTRPTNLGLVELTRRRAGEWDCCDDRNIHRPL